MMTVILPDLPLALAQPYTSLTHHTYFYMYQPLTSTHPLTHLHAPPTFFHAPLICTHAPLTHCHSPLTHFHAPLTDYHALSRTHARHTAFYLCPFYLLPTLRMFFYSLITDRGVAHAHADRSRSTSCKEWRVRLPGRLREGRCGIKSFVVRVCVSR